MTHFPLGSKWLQHSGDEEPPQSQLPPNASWVKVEERDHCTVWEVWRTSDPVNHPSHYTSHPSGVECIAIAEHMTFNLGNAIKYLWRAGDKGNMIQDLEKAAWYIAREIERVKAGSPS